MYTLTNETTKTDILANDPVEVVTSNLPACVSPDNTLLVEGHKREYAVVGDALFASQNIGEAPQWLTSIIDSVIGTSLDSSLTSLVEAQRDLVTSIEELQIANNNYNEIINIDATVDSAVTARVAALNANIAQANATIAELQVTKVSADQASAVAMDVVSSSLNDTAVGTIGGSVSQLNSSINTLASSVSSTRTLVESRYGELNAGIADLQISVDSAIEGVTTAFAYNSVIKIGDDYYKSGFGLKAEATTGGSGTQVDPYSSEFWIDATKLKFTNSGSTGAVSPFTIDASGATPQIAFNGSVSFSSITGNDKPEAGATRNEFKGAWTSGIAYIKGDVVTDAGNTWTAKSAHTASSGNRPPDSPMATSTYWIINASRGNSTHVRYSANADGTNFTISPAVDTMYIGIAVAVTAPVAKTEYVWSRYVGYDGQSGASNIVIYRNVTAKPAAPANGGIPSGWSTSVSDAWTGNVWMCRGTAAAGSSSFTWGPVELDFSSWRAPSKTTIDGAYIETGTITADKISTGVIYNAGGSEAGYTMKIDLDNGSIHIK